MKVAEEAFFEKEKKKKIGTFFPLLLLLCPLQRETVFSKSVKQDDQISYLVARGRGKK